jgi:predicted permease
LIAKDFEGHDMEDEEVQQALRSKQHRWLFFWRGGNAECNWSTSPESLVEEGRLEKTTVHGAQFARKISDPNEVATVAAAILESTQKNEDAQEHNTQKHHPFERHVTFQQDYVPMAGLHEMFHSEAPTLAFPSAAATVVGLTEDGKLTRPSSPSPDPDPPSHHHHSSHIPFFSRVTKLASSLRLHLGTLPAPPTIAVLLACPISVIPPLKALFVPVQNPNNDGTLLIPCAPDGAPPLAFLLDTTSFLGSASVPLALICLGASLAKLKIPKGIRDLPLGAISALTIGRLVLQPIIAIATVEGLVTVGLIDEANKVLRFAMM